MRYELEFSKSAKEDIKRHLKANDRQILKKLYVLLDEIKDHPETGTGEPEQLKSYKGIRWSRRITGKHRLVYDIFKENVIVNVVQAWGHYDDK